MEVATALGAAEGGVCVCVEDVGVELNGAHTSSFPISIWVYVTVGDVFVLSSSRSFHLG